MTTHKEWDGSAVVAHGHISFTFLSALLPSAEGAWVDTTRHLQFLPPSTESCFNITAKLITPFTDLAWHFPWCFSSTVFLFWPLIYFFFLHGYLLRLFWPSLPLLPYQKVGTAGDFATPLSSIRTTKINWAFRLPPWTQKPPREKGGMTGSFQVTTGA